MRAMAVLTYVCGGGESASVRGRRKAVAISMACRFCGGLVKIYAGAVAVQDRAVDRELSQCHDRATATTTGELRSHPGIKSHDVLYSTSSRPREILFIFILTAAAAIIPPSFFPSILSARS